MEQASGTTPAGGQAQAPEHDRPADATTPSVAPTHQPDDRAATPPPGDPAATPSAAGTATPPAAGTAATPPLEDPSAADTAAAPGFRTRGRARRRARFLRKARELAYRDLGGLVFNLHRFGQRNDPLVLAKLNTLTHLDAELHAVEAILHERQPITVLREAGITACPRCAAIHSSEDNFCPNCGLSMDRRVDLPAGFQATAPAPAAQSAATTTPATQPAATPAQPAATPAQPVATPAPAVGQAQPAPIAPQGLPVAPEALAPASQPPADAGGPQTTPLPAATVEQTGVERERPAQAPSDGPTEIIRPPTQRPR